MRPAKKVYGVEKPINVQSKFMGDDSPYVFMSCMGFGVGN